MNAADLDDLLDQYTQQLTNTGNLDDLLDTIRAQGREEDALQQLAAAYLARRAELNTLH